MVRPRVEDREQIKYVTLIENIGFGAPMKRLSRLLGLGLVLANASCAYSLEDYYQAHPSERPAVIDPHEQDAAFSSYIGQTYAIYTRMYFCTQLSDLDTSWKCPSATLGRFTVEDVALNSNRFVYLKVSTADGRQGYIGLSQADVAQTKDKTDAEQAARADAIAAQKADWTKRVKLGMTAAQVDDILLGPPSDVVTRETEAGFFEKRVYSQFGTVYLTNGKVTEIKIRR